MFMSIVYAAVGLGWGFLCFKHRSELLQLQYYISGMIAFLVIENLGSFAYYRYINKHGGGTASFIFLIIGECVTTTMLIEVSILNAGRNSASFFLLLIVAMGLSVVTPTLGSVMNRIRILTIAHFIFGVIYSLGTVEVQLESASIFVVLLMIFPLALTLTAFLMWIIISLNGKCLLSRTDGRYHYTPRGSQTASQAQDVQVTVPHPHARRHCSRRFLCDLIPQPLESSRRGLRTQELEIQVDHARWLACYYLLARLCSHGLALASCESPT